MNARCTGLLLLVAFSITCPLANASSIVVNGGFEDPEVPYVSGFTLFGSIPGWQWTGDNGIEVHRFLNGWLPYEGSQYMEATNQGDTFQSLATTPGQDYVLSFAYSPRPGVEDNPLDVYWDGQIISSENFSGLTNTNTAWTLYSVPVTATSNSTLLEFRSPIADVGTFVDAVSVEAVPLPNSLAMGSIGVLALFAWKEMKKPKTGTSNGEATALGQPHA